MQDDKIQQAIEESLKPQSDINKIIVAIIVTIIPIILTAAGTLAFNIALLIVIAILVIYLGWIFSSRNKSTIDWSKFYDMSVIEKTKVAFMGSISGGGGLTVELYNNYITFVYLSALYENKEKFAQELWDKARISYKSVEDKDEQKK